VDFNSIYGCLQRNGGKKQYFPWYSKDAMIKGGGALLGLAPKDFYAAVRNGEVVGTCAKWDQSGYKQNIIAGYSGKMSMARPLYNAGSGIFGYRPLPDPGKELKSFYLSFMTADNNDPEILRAIVDRIFNESRGGGYHYMLAGLFESDGLSEAFDRYFCIGYKTGMYTVTWPDETADYEKPDNRTPYLEAATL